MTASNKDYNTRRPQMVIPEYGRNIQKMVEHASKIESKEERNKIAAAIISVMGQLNPHLRDIADFKHKLWDHLFIISDFKLDIDSPYPIPDREEIFKKPEKMDYPHHKIKFKHYGKSVEDLISKACEIEDEKERQVLTQIIANLMKKSYLTFNTDSIDDNNVVSDLATLSNGKLKLDSSFEFINTNEIVPNIQKKKTNTNHKKYNGKKQNNNNKRKRY